MQFWEEADFVLDRISDLDTLDALSLLLLDLRELFGIANVAYHTLRVPKTGVQHPLILVTYEHEWVKRYKERDYFKVDPIVLSGDNGFLPIEWSKVDRSSYSAVDFFRDATKYDVGSNGLTMPIRGPYGELALFTITSNVPEAQWNGRVRYYMRIFQLIGHFLHDRAATLGGFRASTGSPSLSRRERECLSEILSGKAPKQIASKLSLSTSAVQLYLKSARNKLNAGNIAEAAILFAGIEGLQPFTYQDR